MKTIIVILLLSVSSAWATCNTGCYEYNGICACDIRPISAPPVQPSDEKPPRDKMPSYQRDGVKVIDIPSCAADDAKQDMEKAEAEAQGMKEAGLK